MNLDQNKLKYIVDSKSTIEDAWSVININDHRSVIVVDGDKVVGTLSDGDLRQAILSKRIFSTPVWEVMNTNFKYITGEKKKEGLNILEKKNIFLLPVVDDEMTLIDIIAK
jgi:CBS domain-containing protein